MKEKKKRHLFTIIKNLKETHFFIFEEINKQKKRRRRGPCEHRKKIKAFGEKIF